MRTVLIHILRVTGHLILAIGLTVLTQTGGLIYLIWLPFSFYLRRVWTYRHSKLLRILAGLTAYALISVLLIPPLARVGGRVPLPWYGSDTQPLQPATVVTCLLNRHYVRPALQTALLDAAAATARTHPGIRIWYLDTGFPFWDRFPLLPHLSHHDGRKADLAFVYRLTQTGAPARHAPLPWGYGASEVPRPGEPDQPALCAQRGHWQYSLLRQISPQPWQSHYQLDTDATRAVIQHLFQTGKVRRILLEPHLKQRLGLGHMSRIRYHGCHAVRHDDHLHVEL